MIPIQINISDRDEESSPFPRWDLVFHNKFTPYHSSTAHLYLEWSTRTDGKWGGRANLRRNVQLDLNSEEIESLVQSTIATPEIYPEEFLDYTQVHTHGGNSPTRSNQNSSICRSISFLQAQKHTTVYLRKDSPLWNDTFWGREISRLLLPYNMESPWSAKQPSRILP